MVYHDYMKIEFGENEMVGQTKSIDSVQGMVYTELQATRSVTIESS